MLSGPSLQYGDVKIPIAMKKGLLPRGIIAIQVEVNVTVLYEGYKLYTPLLLADMM